MKKDGSCRLFEVISRIQNELSQPHNPGAISRAR